MTHLKFRHEIVDSIPETLQSNTLYVTTDRDVAAHLCACGCGREVITPLSPTDWSASFGRQGASLSPSIGNWAFPCRSHYYIRGGAVVWAHNMSDKAIAYGRSLDKARKQNYYDKLGGVPPAPPESTPPVASYTLLNRLVSFCKRLLTFE
jgi:hypothetical protein